MILILFFTSLYSIDIKNDTKDGGILSSAQTLVCACTKNIASIRKSKEFKKQDSEHINLGFSPKLTVWVKLKFHNKERQELTRVIRVDNPLLEDVVFYSSQDAYLPHAKGLLHIKDTQKYLYPTYLLKLKPKETIEIYIKIKNKTTGLQFGLDLLKKNNLDKSDRREQFFIIFFIGILSAFLIYSLVLYIYTKDKSYFLYSAYLFFLIFQQLTFIGFMPLYTPKEFTYIDNLMVVPKVAFMIIAAALFAKKFLRIKKFTSLNKIYNYFILFLILQMPLFGTQWFYLPEVTVLTGFLFVIFNTYCGFYVYFHGNKQARFFIVGWIFLIVGYLIMIFDSLGLISIMYYFPQLILCLTAFEALFLLLAFVDKINILDIQKKELNQELLKEMTNRHRLVEAEVKKKTEELNMAVKEKTTLLRELHHRVKNNLQLILSIIRLQRYDIKDEEIVEQFKKLELRVKSVAKTHEMLCASEDIARVDMGEYVVELCEEIKNGFTRDNVEIRYDIELNLPLCKAVYLGLIINELVSNSIKHAFDESGGVISVVLKESHQRYILSISDNGKGYKETEVNKKTLGLRLVDSLVLNQLDGTIDLIKGKNTEYVISFSKI
ncbi:MAG: 7TM diverse intracellular signaling domain-containing protein [Sulfurospirillum sp.]